MKRFMSVVALTALLLGAAPVRAWDCGGCGYSCAPSCVAYADQVEKDYAEFQDAVEAGRFPVESMPSGFEAAIR